MGALFFLVRGRVENKIFTTLAKAPFSKKEPPFYLANTSFIVHYTTSI